MVCELLFVSKPYRRSIWLKVALTRPTVPADLGFYYIVLLTEVL